MSEKLTDEDLAEIERIRVEWSNSEEYERPIEAIFAAGKAAGRAEAVVEIESLRAECGIRQIAGYNKGKAEAAADTRDAERYRLLRDDPDDEWIVELIDTGDDGTGVKAIGFDTGAELDAAIDAALAAK